jgi:SAM-dependent methyltransferase
MNTIEMKKLNMGCGPHPKEGFTNSDICTYGRNDIVEANLNTKLPFDDNSFDFIEAYMVLEHIQNLENAMREINRVLKPSGIVEITVPYYTGTNAWDDPTHIRAFTSQTLLYFSDENRNSIYVKQKTPPLFKVVQNKIQISAALPFLDIIPKILSPRVYDRLLSHLIPAQGIFLQLAKP